MHPQRLLLVNPVNPLRSGFSVDRSSRFPPVGLGIVAALTPPSWSVELVDTPTAGIDIQPQVAAGLVLVSTVPISMDGFYTGGDRGVLHALDAETGEVVWRFDTVADEPGELWGDPAVNSGGGA